MKDLFDQEQVILDEAKCYLESIKNEPYCDKEIFSNLVTEYSRILKLMRRVTRVSDRIALELNTTKIKLLDTVQYDGLTGIYNRRYLDDELQKDVESCAKTQDSLGILMLDVDHFKLFNDTYGHGAGDDCLRKIAHALEESQKDKEGFVARYGGEEFIIVLPGADKVQLRKAADAAIKSVRALGIPHEKNIGRGLVTVSIGGTCVRCVKEGGEEAYLCNADEALYHSKKTGRDRVTLQLFKET